MSSMDGFEQVTVDALRDEVQRPNQSGAEAFAAGRFEEAERHYAQAASSLTSTEDAIAGAIYENLGFARFNLGWYREAGRAFLRALDGEPTRRPESLRFLILSLISDGKGQWARRMLVHYEDAFGAHPDGVTR